ncbi:MAG: DUF2752 domain-containing protein [Bacteroidaceae bacterium]|nr:DUF2752 domain-containing protein [Bacteroidaceae bacterium]
MEGHTHISVCPSKMFYHIPCPGCGTSRACILWIHGHVADAIKMNPNVLLAISYLVIYPMTLLYDILTRKFRMYIIFKRMIRIMGWKACFIPLLLVELAIWIRNIICGM